MQAYWLDDQRPIGADALDAEGLIYRHLSLQPDAYQVDLDRLKSEQGYVEQDVVELRPDTPNLEGICAKFTDEHTHDDDEVRFVLEGDGIFDVRSRSDAWMRIVVEPGDLLVVPKDRFHRFLLTDKKAIRCVRLFRDPAGWVPNYRAA